MLNLDYFGNTFFLKKLYPEGVFNSIYINEVLISLNGASEFNFFIKQKPLLPVKKWGEWEKDFNALCVKTSSNVRVNEVSILNPDALGYNKLDIYIENSYLNFTSKRENSHINLSLSKNDIFIIQEIHPILNLQDSACIPCTRTQLYQSAGMVRMLHPYPFSRLRLMWNHYMEIYEE